MTTTDFKCDYCGQSIDRATDDPYYLLILTGRTFAMCYHRACFRKHAGPDLLHLEDDRRTDEMASDEKERLRRLLVVYLHTKRHHPDLIEEALADFEPGQ